MALLKKLMAKQKADALREAERMAKRRAARIARKVARVAEDQADGFADLPLEVLIAMPEPAPPVKPEPVPVSDGSVPGLVARLTAIRERIWRLQAMFAVSLSHDCALEANRYLGLFQDLAQQLRAKDAGALDSLVRGHESLLLAPALPIKQSIPLSTQQLVELRWEAATQAPIRRAPERPVDTIHDGLGWML